MTEIDVVFWCKNQQTLVMNDYSLSLVILEAFKCVISNLIIIQ